MIAVLGVRCAATGLRDGPCAATVAGEAPARLVAFDLAPQRALTLQRAAHEVATGRADLEAAIGSTARAHAVARRLRAIAGVGPWTVEMLALYGLGRHDHVPAGDLGFLKMVGRMLTGNPRARAEIDEVRAFFEPYGEWRGLASEYLRWGWQRGLITPPARRSPDPGPRRAGTRWSAPVPRSAAA
jgi:DNA-3-methyladenine glycosylase II